MAVPIAIVTYTATPIPFSSLATPPSVVFSAATSTLGNGSSIVSYQWVLIAKPPGSNTVLSGATTVTCELKAIDLPGGYRLHCVVVNDIGQSSYALPVPSQSVTNPFAFSPPPLSSFGLVYALTEHAGLFKVASGARDWLVEGLWPVVDEVDELRGDHDVLDAAFTAHAIASHDTTATGANLNTMTGGINTDASGLHTHASIPATTITTLTTSLVNERVAGTGVTLDGVLLKDGYPYTRVGGAGVAVAPVAALRARFLNTGTFTTTLRDLIHTIIIPANTYTVAGLVKGQVAFQTAANANEKTMILDLDGIDIFNSGVITNNNALFVVDFVIVRTGTNTQRAYTSANGPITWLPTEVQTNIPQINPLRLFLRGSTPDAVGDLILLWVHATGSFEI